MMQIEVKLERDRFTDNLYVNGNLVRSKKNKDTNIYVRPKQDLELIKLVLKAAGIKPSIKIVDINSKIENVI